MAFVLILLLAGVSMVTPASLTKKSACMDTSDMCETWATNGLCDQDADMADFMAKTCPWACDVCKEKRVAHLEDVLKQMDSKVKRGCEDYSPKCEQFATDGLCNDGDTSSLMGRTCPFACDVCKRNLDKEKRIAHLEDVLKQTETQVKRGCQDYSPKCEQFATDGLCHDEDTSSLMGRTCPFACDVCKRDIVDLDTKEKRIAHLEDVLKTTETQVKRGCEDYSPKCEQFATDGLCNDGDTSSLMGRTCPFACDVCKRETKEKRVAHLEDVLKRIGNKRGCEDYSPKCEQFATDGLCNDGDTSSLMGRTCPFACDVCKRDIVEAVRAKRGASACVDTDPKCEEMATDGFCFDPAHQEYMEKACPFACDVCSSKKRRHARSVAALLGEEQKRSCEDYSPKCEQFATDGLCSDSDTSSLMSKTCPFACDVCGAIKRAIIPEQKRSACADTNSKCEMWATDGLCNSDKDMEVFMAKECPYACDVC